MNFEQDKNTIINFINVVIEKTKSKKYKWQRGIEKGIRDRVGYSIVDELSYTCRPTMNSAISICKSSSGRILLLVRYDTNVPFTQLAPSKDDDIDILASRLYQLVYDSLPNIENFFDKIINDQ